MAPDASSEVMDAVQRLLPGLGGSPVAIHAKGIARLFQRKPFRLPPVMDGMAGPAAYSYIGMFALHPIDVLLMNGNILFQILPRSRA
jgi:hypothetical protein